MSANFETTIRRLWSGLRLPAPTFRDKPEVTLSIDGTDLKLAETADGRGLAVSGRLGRLSADPGERDGQTRRLLQIGLGLMASNCSWVGPDPDDPAGAAILAEARFDYADGRGDRLIGVIENVIQAVEILSPELSARTRREPDHRGGTGGLEEAMIFRP